MIQANARMQADQLFAAMLVLALFSVLLRLLVDRLTASLAPWAREQTHSFRSLPLSRRISLS